MLKKDLIKIFINEIYSKPPRKNYPTNKVIYNHNDEIWSIDLADMIDYKTSNNKGFRYIFIIIDNFSKYLWAIPLKNKYSQTITNEFSNILTTSKRSPLKLESDRGTEFYNSIFQNFLKVKNIQHFSRFTDKGPCLLYTSDAADEEDSVDLGGRRIIKKNRTLNDNCLLYTSPSPRDGLLSRMPSSA